MNLKTSLAAVLAVASCVACAETPVATDFVPGQKMSFPLKSAGVLEDYGRLLRVNCKSNDAAIEQACNAMLSERIAACQGGEPAVFETRESYSARAKRFGACVMPTPICHGVEVTSLEQCKAVATGG